MPSCVYPPQAHYDFLPLIVARAQSHRGSHLYFPRDQTERHTEIHTSDHAAAVARQHDDVHSLLLGNQHFPSCIHTRSEQEQCGLNCCLRAFRRKGYICWDFFRMNGAPPNTVPLSRHPQEQDGPISSANAPLVTLDVYQIAALTYSEQGHVGVGSLCCLPQITKEIIKGKIFFLGQCPSRRG